MRAGGGAFRGVNLNQPNKTALPSTSGARHVGTAAPRRLRDPRTLARRVSGIVPCVTVLSS